MTGLRQIGPARAALTVLAAAAAAFAGLAASGLTSGLHSNDETAEPAPAPLPTVRIDRPAPPPKGGKGVRTVPAPPRIPGAPTVRYKTCRLPNGTALRVLRGTPCPRLPQVNAALAERLRQQRGQQAPAPQSPQAQPGQQQTPAPPTVTSDGKGGQAAPTSP